MLYRPPATAIAGASVMGSTVASMLSLAPTGRFPRQLPDFRFSGRETAVTDWRRRLRPRRLVLLIDVSGSMAPYADALLRFAHAVVRRSPPSVPFH